jgi:Na+/proline symporter/signal transduction histidine kinase/CheY-like chemotaxis protein
MSPSILFIAVFIYIMFLFGLARWGDRQQFSEHSIVRHPAVYALALGVYCTSWTFYGLVGTASEQGWRFLPILLGPILLFTIGYPLLERIRRVTRQEHIHSIADFIASRYGKRQGVAATVSLVVLLAIIPYIALQLKAVSDTLLLTIGDNFLASQDITFLIAVSMIVFSLLFGARRLDMSGYHSGLMSAIAFESVVKIGVLVVIAVFALSWLPSDAFKPSADVFTTDIFTANHMFADKPSWLRFFIETVLAMCAVFCLPRMFHVTFVECLSKEHLKKSRWLFVSYLIIISLCVLLIASVGNTLFYGELAVNGDNYVIALPLMKDLSWLALLAFLGGFSAATAMIIVATITLSQMFSNDVILPLLVRRRNATNQTSDFSRSLIIARRLMVLFVVLSAYLYQIILAENVALTSIGLIAFALVVQLAPGILFGLYWRKGNAYGLYAGLVVGLSLWFYTLMIPLLVNAGLISPFVLEDGLFGLAWLKPESLFGLSFGDSFTRGVMISLGANIIFYCWYSFTSNENFSDRVQANAFTNLEKTVYKPYQDINLEDLYRLLQEFLGTKMTESLFDECGQGVTANDKLSLIEKSQKMLGGIVGIASSQTMLSSLHTGQKLAVEDVVNLFGETTKALRFNQEVMFASFENISSGISVVDSDLKFIAWNHRYETMFDYPDGMLKIGLHVADVMRYNGERGLLGDGNIDDLIRKRLSLMSTANAYRVIRAHSDDMIIEIKGRPLPNGGYVTTYDDITEFIIAQRQLEDANLNLEKRVQERTEKIEEINHDLVQEIERRGQVESELRAAKHLADDANASKTKFLALASHDIMQPLNAANLYASALQDGKEYDPNLVEQLKSAIQNTESIISSLLEISRLESVVLAPNLESFSLHRLLSNLVGEAMVQLPGDLEIRYCKTSLNVRSNKHYLRRILQNFISNAVKYTQTGRVLVGCRRIYGDSTQQEMVEICVIDNGVGISEQECTAIFDDFYRSQRQQQQDIIPGIGLGLSVVKRFSDLLQHQIRCRSELNHGSCFSIRVPIISDAVIDEGTAVVSGLVDKPQDQLKDLRVIYIDDDPQNLLATSTLLKHWHCDVSLFERVEEVTSYANTAPPPDVILMDYQLGNVKVNGVLLAEQLIVSWQARFGENISVPVCIISAATDVDLSTIVAKAGFELLRKPLKPAKLRALLAQFGQRKSL